MRFLTMYQSEVSAISSDAKNISASYIEHPLFSFMDPLCCALHYVFMKYVPDISYSKGYELRSSIKVFLIFRQAHNNKLHPALHLKEVQDIGVEQFRSFIDSLMRNGQSLASAVRIRSALLKVARQNDDGLPLLTLPGVGMVSDKPREPLAEATDAAFYTSMHYELEALQRKLEFRREVSEAKPYSREEVCEVVLKLFNTHSKRGSEWAIDPARALKTLFESGYPFQTKKNEMLQLRKNLRKVPWVRGITKPSDFVLSCCLPYSYSVLRKKTPDSLGVCEIMRMYYPTSHDQAVLALFIQRQTGWNKESVISLDKDKFRHPLSEVAHSNVVMLVSEKNKSQSIKKQSESPKSVWAASSRSDKYSSFNLIRLAKELSEPLERVVNSSRRIGLDDVRKRTVFLCLPEVMADWELDEVGPDVRVKSLAGQKYWNTGVASFLQSHQLIDDGMPLQSAGDLEGRLRVTWEYFGAKQNKHPLSLIALQLGHGNIETTSVSYDSSAMAMKDRKVRYRYFQEELMDNLRSNKFHGIVGRTNQSRSKNPTFRLFTIYGHERALWACTDSSKPDYPGAIELVSGERCTRLDKCLFCSRIYVLGDSLPFIMERLSTLQREIETNEECLDDYRDEIEILEYLLRSWGDESAIANALVYMRGYEVLLPFDMRSLITYIED